MSGDKAAGFRKWLNKKLNISMSTCCYAHKLNAVLSDHFMIPVLLDYERSYYAFQSVSKLHHAQVCSKSEGKSTVLNTPQQSALVGFVSII